MHVLDQLALVKIAAWLAIALAYRADIVDKYG
jgi:hypothetical protein